MGATILSLVAAHAEKKRVIVELEGALNLLRPGRGSIVEKEILQDVRVPVQMLYADLVRRREELRNYEEICITVQQ